VLGDRPGDPNVDMMRGFPRQGPGRGGEPVGGVWAGRGSRMKEKEKKAKGKRENTGAGTRCRQKICERKISRNLHRQNI